MGSKSPRNSERNPLPSILSEARLTVRRADSMKMEREDVFGPSPSPPPPAPRSPAPAWRSPAAPPPQQRLSQRQARMWCSHLGSSALVAPIAPAAPVETSGDGGRRRHPGARALVLDARLGAVAATAATAAAAGACGAWRVLRRRRGDRSARGARPRPQRHPPSGDPRGVHGAGPVS